MSAFQTMTNDAGAVCPDVVATYFHNDDPHDPTACAQSGCHTSNNPAGGLDMATPGLLDRLIGVESTSESCGGRMYVDLERPERSLLYTKLSARPPCGAQMPLGQSQGLSHQDRACVLEWVRELAEAAGNVSDGGAPRRGMGDTDRGMNPPPDDAGMTQRDDTDSGTSDTDAGTTVQDAGGPTHVLTPDNGVPNTATDAGVPGTTEGGTPTFAFHSS